MIPFGNDVTNDYLPLIFGITAPGSGGSGSITCSTYPTDPFVAPNNRPLPTGLTSLTDLSGTENAPNVVDRFWPMRTDDYSIPPTATITFTYRDGEWNTGTNTINREHAASAALGRHLEQPTDGRREHRSEYGRYTTGEFVRASMGADAGLYAVAGGITRVHRRTDDRTRCATDVEHRERAQQRRL
ncbi:MAG: hypothetical protein IPI55_17275 [Flavobacteriales bacterium]|nr:hypothetical protein [Flavobacteriales bacterium]